MAKKKKGSSYAKMVKKALNRAKWNANPAAAKMNKTNRLEASAKKMSNKMTSPERIFVKMMKEIGIECISQKVIGNKIFDFYIPLNNLVVEIHGDYWHANPIIYENKELNNVQTRNVKNDKFKEVLAKGRGYLFYVIWEYDLNNDYKKQKEKLKKLLKDV